MFDDLPLTEALVGAAAAVAALSLAKTQPQEFQRPLPGVVVVVAAAGWGVDLVPGRLLVAMFIGFLAGFSADRELRWFGGFVAVAGLSTVLPLAFDSTERLAVAVAVFVVAVVVSQLPFTAHSVVLVVLAGTTVGGFLAAPDTERIALVGGALAVVVVGAILLRAELLRVDGLVVLAALVVWAGTTDARGRPASLVATIVPVVMVVVVALIARRGRVVRLVAVIPVMAGLAVLVGRVAGLRSDSTTAWLLGGAAFAVGTGCLWLLSRPVRAVSAAPGGRRSPT